MDGINGGKNLEHPHMQINHAQLYADIQCFFSLTFDRLGLDPKLLAKILNMSSGRCWSSDTYNPVPGVMDGVPSANNYQGGFGTTLMAKVCNRRN